VEFEIPKDVVSRKDLMTLEFRDIKREKISELAVPLEIKGLARPKFSYRLFVDEAALSAKDKGNEDIELTLWLKNIGEGKAFEPTVLLRNESGTAIFLKNGRFQTGELAPNQETSTKFSFRIKEPVDQVKFELQIFDGKMHDLWRDKVVLNISENKKTTNVKKTLVLNNDSADILAAPRAEGDKIAVVKKGITLLGTKEVGDYFKVLIDKNLSGYINKALVKEAKEKTKTPKKNDFYSINYNRIPPKVSLKFGDGSGFSKTGSGLVEINIADKESVLDLLLYVNGKKVLYREMKPDSKKKIEHQVNLKPGVNAISLFAREDSTYGQRENITVYFDSDGKASAAMKNTQAKAVKN